MSFPSRPPVITTALLALLAFTNTGCPDESGTTPPVTVIIVPDTPDAGDQTDTSQPPDDECADFVGTSCGPCDRDTWTCVDGELVCDGETACGGPVVRTLPIEDLRVTGATLAGELVESGEAASTSVGFCYGQGTALSPGNAGITCTPGEDLPNLEQFREAVTGLTPGERHHYRAWAQAGDERSYGATVAFLADLNLAFVQAPLATYVAGEPFALDVQLVDGNGAPLEIADFRVRLDLTGTTFADGSSTHSAPTNASGVASFELEITRAADDLRLVALSADGVDADPFLESAPFAVLSGPASLDNSSISAPETADADGVAEALVTVTLADEFGNPLVGVTPIIEVEGPGTTIRPCGPTNAQGIAECGVQANITGVKTIRLVSPIALTGPDIEFRLTTQKLWGGTRGITAVALDDDHVYIGGPFAHVGPGTGSFTTIDRTTGVANPPWPEVIGRVRRAISDGQGGWFIAGSITRVGDAYRNNLAHIRANGTVNPDFNPDPNGQVTGLAIDGDTLFVSGTFTQISGVARKHIAALDVADGSPRSWGLQTDFATSVFNLTLDGDRIYASGSFGVVNGTQRRGIVALARNTGDLLPWNPELTFVNSVNNVTLDGDRIYIAGSFSSKGPGTASNLLALRRSDATAIPWEPSTNGTPFFLHVTADRVYAALYEINGLIQGLVAYDKNTGATLDWTPDAPGIIIAAHVINNTMYAVHTADDYNDIRRSRLVAVDLQSAATTVLANDIDGPVSNLASAAGNLVMGGDFSMVGGTPRNGLARLNRDTGEATNWVPEGFGRVLGLVLDDTHVYAHGDAIDPQGTRRYYMGAFSKAPGAQRLWQVELDRYSDILAIDDTYIYAGSSRVRSYRKSDGAPGPLNLNTDFFIYDLAVDADHLYVAGNFTTIGGVSRSYLVAIRKSDWTITDWNPAPNAAVVGLDIDETHLYLSGAFDAFGPNNQIPRIGVAILTKSTGIPTDWVAQPGVLSDRYIRARSDTIFIGASRVDRTSGNPLGGPVLDPRTTIWGIAADDRKVYIIGNFTTVDGDIRRQIFGMD